MNGAFVDRMYLLYEVILQKCATFQSCTPSKSKQSLSQRQARESSLDKVPRNFSAITTISQCFSGRTVTPTVTSKTSSRSDCESSKESYPSTSPTPPPSTYPTLFQEITKSCSTCGQTKSISEFWRNSWARDGWASNCKDCRRASRLRTINRQQKRFEARRYYENNREHVINRMRSYYINKRDEIRARTAVATGLRTGALVRQLCEICGKFPTDAHHDDYKKPLKVRWLCRRHHREHHLQLTANFSHQATPHIGDLSVQGRQTILARIRCCGRLGDEREARRLYLVHGVGFRQYRQAYKAGQREYRERRTMQEKKIMAAPNGHRNFTDGDSRTFPPLPTPRPF